MEKKLKTVVLGTKGGLTEGNLTAYLLASKNNDEFVCIDAGTVLSGLKQATAAGSFEHLEIPDDYPLTIEGYVQQECIKAYLLSHAHMDHIMGLAVNSTHDNEKNIVALPKTIEYLREHIFNWKSWPNLADAGVEPRLNKYHYVELELDKEKVLPGMSIAVTPFKVSHSNPYESTAFLVRHEDAQLLFIGDTGPDPVEKSDRLQLIWSHIAPLVRNKSLRGIFIETSYSNGRSDHMLFGHLTPSWMMYELERLARLVDPRDPDKALAGFPVVVTSIKPTFHKASTRNMITTQLHELNHLSIDFIMPEQGQLIEF